MRINEIIIKIDKDTIKINTYNNPFKSIILLCICRPQILFIVFCYSIIYLIFFIFIISYTITYLNEHSFFIPLWIINLYNKNYYIYLFKETISTNLNYIKYTFIKIGTKYICNCN